MCKKIYFILLALVFSLAIACSDQQPASVAEKNVTETVPTDAAKDIMPAMTPDTGETKVFYENLHYARINPAQPTQSDFDHIEVVEMFFYACPHCYKLEPTIERWLKTRADDVDFVRVPAIIGPTWAEQAKIFYIAEELGIADSVRKKIFYSIHKDGKQYYNEYSLMAFFEEQGVNSNRFLELYQSKEIMEKASTARAKTVGYGIRGVPAIIVNGEYYTATYFVRDHDEMLKVVDFLIDKVREEKKAAAESKK
ncbi:MAG: thiol:disulfide interchange protein DsbA/DsbL [Gammaproteobacteria bacterium]|nr:thiol:disulfide interchange protein DsbA/DsbL [Gammaproteobacteria bacterium]